MTSEVPLTATPAASSSSTHTEPCIAAALVKASPLPPSRKLLKRTSSTGYATMNCPYLPKRRRITGKSAPRIEFVRPGSPGYRHAAEPPQSSSSTTDPTSSVPVLPVIIPAVLLPVRDLDKADFRSLYDAYSEQNLANGFVDRQKIKTWLRAAVMKHHRFEITAMVSKKKKLPVDVRNKTFGCQLQWACQQYMTAMTLSMRQKLFGMLYNDTTGQNHAEDRCMIVRWMYRQDHKISMNEADSDRNWVHARNVMLTWIGDFGIIAETGLTHHMSNSVALASALENHDFCLELFASMKMFVHKLLEEYHLLNTSCSLELCCETLAEQKIIRVHCHAFLEARQGKKIHVRNPESLKFEGVLPQKRTDKGPDAIGVRSSSQPGCGHYYLRMPKVGLVFSCGTGEPFINYRINPEWILSYVQNGKLTAKSARAEILKTWKNCKQHIEALKYCEDLHNDAAIDVVEKKILTDFMASLPPLRNSVVLRDWKAHMAKPGMRHMPLVLDGPTQTFKTTAAKTFALNIDNYIELNCSNLSHEPNLRSVRFGTEVINFDELKAKTFIENKKVFQGAIGQTTLGENTAAGAQAYTRRLNGIKMIICSNHFKRDVSTLTDEDQDYVWKNIFYLELAPGETMFEDPNPVDTGDALSLEFQRMYVGVCGVCVCVCVSSML